MKVVCNIDAGKILRRRGLQPGGPVQRWFTTECARLMDSYVPMQSGPLKDTKYVGYDQVEYRTPYAHYQYRGVLMLAPNGSCWARTGERKHDSDRELTYHGAPKRGKEWDKRMWADHGKRLTAQAARMCGGRVK
jgi:hypothetical protein